MTWWLVQHVVATTVFASLVALVCRLMRLGPVAQHALWLLVLIKFVTPPMVEWPWTLPDPLGLSGVYAVQGEGASSVGSASLPIEEIVVGEPFPGGEFRVVPRVPSEPPLDLWTWLLWVWLGGSLVRASIEGGRLARLHRWTRRASVADDDLTTRAEAHAARLGLPPVSVVVVEGTHAPSVWGLTTPHILWPANLIGQLSSVSIDGLLVHELAHVKRRDHLVGWVELIGGVVWWWNPMFWFVRASLREQAELACDAWVISTLPDGRRAYAESLLSLSSAVSRAFRPSMAVVGISATTRRALERRLVMIMKGRTSLRLTLVGICSLVVLAAATLPTWAASPQTVQPSTPPPAATPAPPAPAQMPAPPPPAAQAQRPATPPVVPVPTARPSGGRGIVTAAPATMTPAPSPQGAPFPAVRGRGGVTPTLPTAAHPLVDAFEKDQQAYLAEMQQKIEARRATFRAEMQRLQDELTRAGNLDDAVAIRDYLRRSAPAGLRPMVGRGGRGGAVEGTTPPAVARGRIGGGL